MVQQTAKRWRPSVLTKTRGDQALGRAKLARLLVPMVLAAVLSLAGTGHYAQAQPGEANGYGLDAEGVAPSGEGPGRVTAAPVTYAFTITAASNPNDSTQYGYKQNVMGSITPATFTYEGTTHTVTAAYRDKSLTGYDEDNNPTYSYRYYVTVSPSLPGRWIGASVGSTSWDCPTASSTCTYSGSLHNTSLTIRLHPNWSLGTPTGALVTTDPSNIAVTVDVPISDANAGLSAPLTWTFSPIPEGATSPENATSIATGSGSGVKVTKVHSGLAPDTQYTVRVKKQGASDSAYKTLQQFQYVSPDSVELGTPTGSFSGTDSLSYTLSVTVPVTVTGGSVADKAPLTWTITPTPSGTDSPQHVFDNVSSGNVTRNFTPTGAYTAYTVKVKPYGGADDSAKALSVMKIPDHIPFHAPGILKVTDETPADPGTASLLVAWSGAPAAPVTGFWVRYNKGIPLRADSGRETNILRRLPPIARNVNTVDIEVLAYYSENAEVSYRGEDHTVPTGETWYTPWSETYSINIARGSRTGSEVPPKPVAPLVVDTAGKLLEASGLPADQAHSYSLLFLLFLTLGVGGFLYAATGGGPMSATLAGFVGVIIWSGLGWWWFGLPVAMALVPLMLIIIVGGMVVTTRVLS